MSTRYLLMTVLAVVCYNSPALALSIRPGGGSPKSWQRTSANGRFLFAMITPNAADDFPSGITAEEREAVTDLRQRYPRAGMYRVDTGELIWETTEWLHGDWFLGGFTAIVSNDGNHLVWLSTAPALRAERQSRFSRWWNGPQQKFSCLAPLGSLDRRRDQPAIRFLTRTGTVSVMHGDFLIDDSRYPKAVPFTLSWLESAEIEGGTLVVVTNDDQTLTFDLDTGEWTRGGATRDRAAPYLSAAILFAAVPVVIAVARRRRWNRPSEPEHPSRG